MTTARILAGHRRALIWLAVGLLENFLEISLDAANWLKQQVKINIFPIYMCYYLNSAAIQGPKIDTIDQNPGIYSSTTPANIEERTKAAEFIHENRKAPSPPKLNRFAIDRFLSFIERSRSLQPGNSRHRFGIRSDAGEPLFDVESRPRDAIDNRQFQFVHPRERESIINRSSITVAMEIWEYELLGLRFRIGISENRSSRDRLHPFLSNDNQWTERWENYRAVANKLCQ